MKKTIWIDILCNEYADESNYLAKILEYGSEKGINNNNREFEVIFDDEMRRGDELMHVKTKVDGKEYDYGLYYKLDVLYEMYGNSYDICPKPIKKYIDTYKDVLDKDVERDYGDDIVRKIGDIHKVKKLLKEWEEEQTEVREKETDRRKIRKKSEERLRKKQKKEQEKIIRKLRLK